jgi:hypothetical protein
MIVQNLWYNLEVPELFLPACSDVPDHLPPGLKITRQGVKQSSNDHAQVTILWTTKSRSKCVNKPMLANDIFKKTMAATLESELRLFPRQVTRSRFL